jgi:hypothetical protein
MASPDHEPAGSALTTPDWRAAIALRWMALGLDLLGIGSGPRRKLTELGEECQALAILTAFFECGGNLTHTAARVGVSRRACRVRLAAWSRRNPDFVPPLPKKAPEAGKPRRRPRVEPDGHARGTGVHRTMTGGQGSEAKEEW